MKKLFILLFLPALLSAQTFNAAEQCASNKQAAFDKQMRNARVAFPGDASIDVNYYKIDVTIDVNSKSIRGASTVAFTALSAANNFFLDLNNSHQIDSVVSDGKSLKYNHVSNRVTIEADLAADQQKSVTVYYQGRPPSNNFGSFEFGTHGPQNFPVVWSLSEPYGAPDWWACKDNPNDKADSSDVWITMPKEFVSVSNGKLMQTVDNGNLRTYQWQNRYPITHYLISVACSNYTQYDDYFNYSPADSMLISHFIYPEAFTSVVKNQLDKTIPMLEFFSKTFGEYPFIKEKYGHAQCGFGGGMEHQTVSSMGGFNTGLVAHELAHQWFGDYVTCKTWSDIWVNEGFATFSEALYAESVSGELGYQREINENMDFAKEATGSIFVQNTSSINQIFNYRRTYAKGATVLHMLRGVLGDETFFKALKNYLNQYQNSVASIRDFQAVVEQTSNQDLKYFFDEWLFGTGYPTYNFGWQSEADESVSVTIEQDNTSGNELFQMPVDLKLTLADNSEKTVTVMVSKAEEKFTIQNLSAAVTDVEFDPKNKILKDVSEFLFVTANEPNEDDNIVLFPNPTSDILQIKGIDLERADVSLFNAAGQSVKTPSIQNNSLNINNLTSGKYFLLIRKNGSSTSKRVVKGFVKR
jgi:aminopeptidase N